MNPKMILDLGSRRCRKVSLSRYFIADNPAIVESDPTPGCGCGMFVMG